MLTWQVTVDTGSAMTGFVTGHCQVFNKQKIPQWERKQHADAMASVSNTAAPKRSVCGSSGFKREGNCLILENRQ